jgi:hypothetical protein
VLRDNHTILPLEGINLKIFQLVIKEFITYLNRTNCGSFHRVPDPGSFHCVLDPDLRPPRLPT